jgi:hypothetical protein
MYGYIPERRRTRALLGSAPPPSTETDANPRRKDCNPSFVFVSVKIYLSLTQTISYSHNYPTVMAYFTGLLALVGLLSILCYKFALWLSYRSNIRRHGCTAPPQYAHKDPFFGLDHFVNTMNAFKNGHFLDYKTSQFAKYGKTFQTNNFGTILFETIDPEVSKAVHSTHSANFGLQPLRYETAKHLWGNGIVVVDGEEWKRGRALIRASFDVVHVANFQRLRRHTETLFALLPQDGSTVDLMPLFKRLVCFHFP